MTFLRDLKYAVRSLWRVRTLWATVAFTLALGIGANAAIFSVIRAVLLRPLANRDEDRLLYVQQSAPGIGNTDAKFSVPEIEDLSRNLKTVTQTGTFSTINFTIVGLGTPREVPGGVVDGHYFDVIGLRPVLGRLLNDSDDGPNAAGAMVLTYRFWKESLHSDPNVLGKAVRLESASGARSATVVGVLEPSVPYPVATEFISNIVTSPHHLSATMVTGREHRMTDMFMRLAPGATLDGARAELQTRYAAMTAAHPETYKLPEHFQINARRMHDQINARANTILWVLFAASALLFVIGCLNVANLVLARTVRRESELAVRSALGANTVALRRLLLAESLVLCGSGVLGALLLAWPMVAALGHYVARYSVRADRLSLDSTLVWFGIGLALLASVFLAYVPRLPSERAELTSSLNGGGTRSNTGRGNNRLRVFAVMQIAASFVLLTGAATLMRTLYTLESTPPPFDPSRVLAINLPVLTYGKTPQQVQEFYREVPRRVSTLPGVTHASTGFCVPWRDAQGLGISFTFAAPGAAVSKNGLEDWRAKFRSISPGYFGTLGVPLIAGRDFRDSDKEGSGRVVIVSQKLAQTLFPGQSVLNHDLRWTDGVMKFIGISMEPRRIVGVVPDFDDENIIPSPEMMVYEPADQEGWNGRLLVNVSGGDPYSLAPAIRRTIHDISAEQPVERISTLNDIRAEVMVPDKLNAVVFGGFALVALLISVVGVAGVLAFSVSSRTREFGIRMALGAKPRDILQDVLRQGVSMATIGVIAGVLLGIVFAHGLGRYITEVQVPGTPALLISGFVIVAAAVIASAVPAARAARVNAIEALRAE